MPIYTIKAPNGKIYEVSAPEGASQEDVYGYVQQQVDEEKRRRELREYGPGLLETGARAVKRGFQELGATVTDIVPAAVGSMFGFDEYAKEQLKEAEEKRARWEAEAPTLFQSYKEVESLGDFPKFVIETLGGQVANIGTALIPGIGGGVLAGRMAAAPVARAITAEAVKKGLTKEATEEAVKRGVQAAAPGFAGAVGTGQAAGAFLGSYALSAPEIFENIYQETQQLEPGAAAIYGAGAAALDSILPATLARQLTMPAKIGIVEKVLEKSGMDKGLLRSMTASLLQGIPTEALTEGAQEAISIAAERFVDENPKVFGSKEWDRIMESAVRGAVAGGGFGVVGGGVEGLRAKAAQQRKEAEEARLEGKLDEAERLQQEADAAETAYLEGLNKQAELEQVKQQQFDEYQQGLTQMQLPGMETAYPTTRPETPISEPEVKAPKVTQAEMFTAEGELTPQMEKAAVRGQKAAEKQQKERETQFKKDQQELKARLEELAPPKNLVSLAQTLPQLQQTVLQAQEDLNALAKKRSAPTTAPAPTVPTPSVTTPTAPVTTAAAPTAPAPITLEDIQRIDDPVAFGKLLGIGRTARILRPDGPLAGLDLSKPEDAAQIKTVLDAYASGKPAAGAATKIEAFLKRPEFQGAPDATRTDQQPSGEGAGVSDQGVGGAAPAPMESVEPGRVDVARGDVDQLAGREAAQPGALTPEVQRAVDFVNAVDAGGIPLAPAKIRKIAEDLGLEVKKSAKPQETIQRVREAVGRATPQPRALEIQEATVTPTPVETQVAPTSAAPTETQAAPEPAAEFTPEEIAEAEAELEQMYGEPRTSREELEERRALVRRKKATPEELRALDKEAVEESKKEAIYTKTGKKLSLPKYEGPVFDEAQRKLAEAGDVNGLLRNLLDSIQDPAIKQVLRRLRSLNLKTKIKIAPIGQSGIYNNPLNETDPDTIFLDPEQGMNAHTFIHEALHAAISNVLENRSHPLTKQFTKFFISIQDRLGAAYGATDLQEFAAELISNPSFQAVLKTIKAPKSENMFVRIMQTIAEFLGFPPKTTAFEKSLNFINDAIDITNDVPATAAQRLFLGDGKNQSEFVQDVAQAQPSLAGKTLEDTRNFLSNLSGSDVQRLAFGLLRLDNIYNLYKKELPSIKMLLDALEKRVGSEEKFIGHASENFKRFAKIQKQHPAAMRALNNLAIEISDAQVNVLADKFELRLIDRAAWEKMTDKQRDDYQMVEAQRKRDYNVLKPRFDALPKEVKDVYRAIRKDYDASFARYRAILEQAAEGSPALLAQLREEFTLKQPLIGYVPYRRFGDFWLEFIDPDTDAPVAMAFDSIRERDQFAARELKGIDHQKYEKLENIVFNQNNIPPTHFLSDIVKKLRSQGASEAQINSVYQSYLAAFPAESIAKQFMKRTGVRGMEKDIVRSYNDLMVRWGRKLANSEYLPQIDRALMQIAQEGQAHQRNTGGDPAVGAAVQNILSQSVFFHNPTYGTLVSGATQLSFFEFMAGNISSAIINLTSLPLMVFPLLTGKFGWADVMPAMLTAGRTAMNDWGKMARYKKLYDTLDEHGQLKHTMAREVLEGRRQKTEDYTGLKARIMDGLAIPFSVTERYNRGATAIAAFDLAKKNGMTDEQAIDYALELVKTAHTSGMAATGPRWMQAPLGRIFFTFKSFIWNSAYVLARAFYQSFKGETPKIREAARHQLLATYGMATVFTGVKGMPFYGAVSVLAEMLNTIFGDDDEPFDFDEFMRDVFGEFLYKGAFNYFTNLEVANRAGLATDLVFRDDPRGVAEHGYVLSALQQLFGPVGSIAVNSGRAVEMFKQGHYERAVETIAPSFVRNGMKGARYLSEGALTLKGDPVDEDINAYNSLMQVIGFAPADLSNRYEMLQMAKGFERKVELRRRDALRLYDIAVRSGDTELMEEVRDRIQSFNEKYPKYRITQDSLRRSQRAREAAEKDMIYGVRFNKNLRGEIKERFFEDEEE